MTFRSAFSLSPPRSNLRLLLAAFFLATAHIAAAQTLDTFKLGAQTVTAKLPPPSDLACAGKQDFEGWSYEFDSYGHLSCRQLGNGGGDEIARLYAARAPHPLVQWRAKIVLFDDVDALSTTAKGVLRERRSGSFGPDMHGVLDAIALLGSMVDAYTAGKVEFIPELEVEEQSMRFDVPAEKPFTPEFARTYFGPRVNVGAFQADDSLYRGPYGSVFFLHFGLTNTNCQTEVNDTPVTGLAYYYAFDKTRPQMLANRLFNAWIGHVLFQASRHGYELGSLRMPPSGPADEHVRIRLPQGLITDEMWQSLCNLKDTNDFSLHRPAATGTPPWSKVAPNPWGTARLLGEQEAKAMSIPEPALNADEPAREVSVNGQRGVLCEPEFAQFVAHAAGGDPACLGYFATQAGPKLLLQSGSSSPELQQNPPKTSIDFRAGDPGLPVGGYLAYKVIDDPDQGKAAFVTDEWVARSGWIRLLGPGPSGPPVDASHNRYLDLTVKNIAFGHSILIEGTEKAATYDLYVSDDPSPESPEPVVGTFDLPPDGAWHHVVIDASGLGRIKGIYLTSGNARWWPVSLDSKPSMLIASATLSSSGTPTPFRGDPVADAIRTKLLLAASTTQSNYASRKPQLMAMLKDLSLPQELNAANVFTRVKDRSAEDALGELAKSIDPRVACIALRALDAQGTDTARGSITLTLTNGPFDANRYWAGTVLKGQNDPYLAESFSRLIDSKSWETRLVAAEALSVMPGEKAKAFFTAFLLDSDPQNEVEVASHGPVTDDLFEKRMQWYALNDASDEMRLACNEDLLESTLPAYPEEGIKGLHDDSWWVRRSLLQFLTVHPDAKWHGEIVSALGDANEEVRAEAIGAWAALPGKKNRGDLASVKEDKDLRVLKALATVKD